MIWKKRNDQDRELKPGARLSMSVDVADVTLRGVLVFPEGDRVRLIREVDGTRYEITLPDMPFMEVEVVGQEQVEGELRMHR